MGTDLSIEGRLHALGLTNEEAAILLSLIDAPKTLLEASRATGIARSNVYRIVDGLIQKSIVHMLTTDNGGAIAAARPEALELLVIEQETAAEAKRSNFTELLPLLTGMQGRDNAFAIRTYTGLSGLRQMVWNELSATDELLIFSGGPLDLGTGRRWAEKYRHEVIERGLKQRGLENEQFDMDMLTEHADYTHYYTYRYIPKEILTIQPEITIHDDTVSLYNCWTNNAQLGTEIKNPFLARFMREVFEHYWSIATPPTGGKIITNSA